MNRPFRKNTCIRKNRDRSSLLFMEMIPPQQTKNTLRLSKKEAALRRKENLKFTRRLPSSAIFFSSEFYKRLKFSSIVLCFPFFPFLCRSHFHRLSIFIFHFRKLSFSSQYTQNYPHCIPLIHGILRSYPPYPQPYARFPDICRKL